jgi:cytochrome c-type biogenesis protein CcmH/NrfF
MTLPLAHVGHYLWVLYLLPILFVVGGIVKTVLAEKRRKESEED